MESPWRAQAARTDVETRLRGLPIESPPRLWREATQVDEGAERLRTTGEEAPSQRSAPLAPDAAPETEASR